jgi:hypothetical protein
MARLDCVKEAKGGFRDLYWCYIINEPTIVYTSRECVCGNNVDDLNDRHVYIGHVVKP